jgi:hypothetical protein
MSPVSRARIPALTSKRGTSVSDWKLKNMNVFRPSVWNWMSKTSLNWVSFASTADEIVGLPELATGQIDKARLLVKHAQQKMKRRLRGVRPHSRHELRPRFGVEALLDEEPAS